MTDVTDMRGYIDVLEGMGELRHIDGADLKTEVGALTELAADKEGPALLFSNFKDYPTGFRVISNVFRTCKRTGPAMGINEENGIDYLYAWRKKLAAYKPVPVNQLEGGPVLENQMAGNDVDLYKFPVPNWHDLDGGPYIGTGCGIITKDPETGARQHRHLSRHGPRQEPRFGQNEYGQARPARLRTGARCRQVVARGNHSVPRSGDFSCRADALAAGRE